MRFERFYNFLLLFPSSLFVLVNSSIAKFHIDFIQLLLKKWKLVWNRIKKFNSSLDLLYMDEYCKNIYTFGSMNFSFELISYSFLLFQWRLVGLYVFSKFFHSFCRLGNFMRQLLHFAVQVYFLPNIAVQSFLVIFLLSIYAIQFGSFISGLFLHSFLQIPIFSELY